MIRQTLKLKPVHKRRQRREDWPEEDPTGKAVAIRDFNEHEGPARIFYNRNNNVFSTTCYPAGSEKWFGEMMNGIDMVELYRKTTSTGNLQVKEYEIDTMVQELRPYARW